MPFDKKKAAEYITKPGLVLPPYGNKQCATNVRKALEAGGLLTTGHPESAKDWGPTLQRIGFVKVNSDATFQPATGDVIVIQDIPGHKSGHIELFDGNNWVSDFIQEDMWPARAYKAHNASYQTYRYSL